MNFDFAIEGVEIGTDNVEANATAGKFGFYVRGGEARVEKHFAEIALGEAIGGFRRDEPAFDSTLFDAFVVDAAAVVLDFDVDVVAAMIGAQRNFADFRFAGCDSIRGSFDAVSDGIANQVD